MSSNPQHINLWLGSTNPAKIAAAQTALLLHSEGVVAGVSVASGVSEQPMSDEETRAGAEGRAKAALQHGVIQGSEGVILGMGLEGGVVELADGLWNTVWACVATVDGKTYSTNGSRFRIPEGLAEKIRQGAEMGPLLAEVTGIDDIRSKEGFIGQITEGWVTRSSEYANLAGMALGLWHGREWQQQMENKVAAK